jgi:hypothetical protein
MRDSNHLLLQVVEGAAAGLVGTFLLRGIMAASAKWTPGAVPPMRKDPGEFMVEQGKRALPQRAQQAVSGRPRKAAAQALALGYGMTFGALYAALRPRGGSTLRDGTILGLLCWAVGYLGWLPASGLMPPIWRHNAKQIASPPMSHAMYGMATVAAYDLMRRQTVDA